MNPLLLATGAILLFLGWDFLQEPDKDGKSNNSSDNGDGSDSVSGQHDDGEVDTASADELGMKHIITPVELKRLRQSKGISQAKLARAVGIQRSYVSQYENGRYIFDDDVLERLKGYLEC